LVGTYCAYRRVNVQTVLAAGLRSTTRRPTDSHDTLSGTEPPRTKARDVPGGPNPTRGDQCIEEDLDDHDDSPDEGLRYERPEAIGAEDAGEASAGRTDSLIAPVRR